MSPPFPIAVLGAGWVVEHAYLPHLSGGPVEVVAIHDPDGQRAERIAQQLGQASGMRTLEECLEEPSLGVLVCVPPALHSRLLPRLMEMGKSVLCEKPVAPDLETVKELQGVPGIDSLLMGSATMRLRADVQQLLAWVASGALGTLRRARLCWWRQRGVPSPGSWRTTPRCAPGGVLDDLGPHLLDILTGLLPAQECASSVVTEATLECRHGSAPRSAQWFSAGSSPSSYTVPDFAQARLVTLSGLTIDLEVSWDRDEAGDRTLIELEGSRGTAVLDGLFGFSTHRSVPHQTCRLSSLSRQVQVVEFEPGPALQVAAFGASLRQFAEFSLGRSRAVASCFEVLQVGVWLEEIRQRARALQEALP